LLSLRAVRSLRLANTLVATLISCYSGLWPSASADQVEHAAGAFLEAGAGSVVACLWPAFDHPAYLFTEAFYGGAGAGEAISDAFAAGVEAIRTFEIGNLTPYAHPVYWAGFTLFAGVSGWWKAQSELAAAVADGATSKARAGRPSLSP
jgi:hypothetical protein